MRTKLFRAGMKLMVSIRSFEKAAKKSPCCMTSTCSANLVLSHLIIIIIVGEGCKNSVAQGEKRKAWNGHIVKKVKLLYCHCLLT